MEVVVVNLHFNVGFTQFCVQPECKMETMDKGGVGGGYYLDHTHFGMNTNSGLRWVNILK